MLVLGRQAGESIRIGEDVRITVLRIGPVNVRIGITAPGSTRIVREELELEVLDGDVGSEPRDGRVARSEA